MNFQMSLRGGRFPRRSNPLILAEIASPTRRLRLGARNDMNVTMEYPVRPRAGTTRL